MSIPKIIHYCWFGGGPISPESRKCIESWKKYCPDYKIIEWNEQNFEISQNRYAQQAYEAKKYAFVSDYVRLAVLYEYGGIYLDTDVELVRPLDELLEHKGFIGMEHSAPSPYGRTLLVNTGSGVGAEPGCEMIGKMLAAYRNAAFIHNIAGQDKERDCQQAEHGNTGENALRAGNNGDFKVHNGQDGNHGRNAERHRDGHACDQHNDQQDQDDQPGNKSNVHCVFLLILRWWSCVLPRCRWQGQ